VREVLEKRIQGHIDDICRFAEIARNKGLLSMEDAVMNCEDSVLKAACMLIVDATPIEKVRGVLEQRIQDEIICGKSEQEVLPLRIITEGVMCITEGVKPDMIRVRLNEMIADSKG